MIKRDNGYFKGILNKTYNLCIDVLHSIDSVSVIGLLALFLFFWVIILGRNCKSVTIEVSDIQKSDIGYRMYSYNEDNEVVPVEFEFSDVTLHPVLSDSEPCYAVIEYLMNYSNIEGVDLYVSENTDLLE